MSGFEILGYFVSGFVFLVVLVLFIGVIVSVVNGDVQSNYDSDGNKIKQ